MNENKNIIYTAADVQQYLDGKLSPMQMHAMEKAALDDDFLAEAIEGYANNKDANWQTYLQQAKENIALKNNEQAKIVAIGSSKKMWLKVAAAIVVLAGGAIAYNILNKPTIINTPEQIAVVTPSVINDTIVDTPNPTPTETAVVTTKQKTIDIDKTPIPITLANVVADSLYTPTKPTKIAAKKTNDRDVALNTTPAAAPTTLETAKADDVAKDKDAKSYDFENVVKAEAKKKVIAKQQPNYNFISQVVAADNSPLPFANISIKEENFGTYADVKGNFRLNSPDSLLTVEVKSVGYLPKYYTLNAKTNLNKIVLTEDKIDANNQVVLKRSTNGKASRKATFLKDSIVNVEPADGWDNYSTYVSNNIDIPDDILNDKSRRGQVEVSFNVSANGAITNIKIDKTACNNCDEEAVKKLIQQGPQWKLKKGVSGAAKLKVQF